MVNSPILNESYNNLEKKKKQKNKNEKVKKSLNRYKN